MTEHRHQWQVARVEQVGTFGPYVYFGCVCGEAISTQATPSTATRLKQLVRQVLFAAKPVDQLLVDGQPALAVPIAMLDKLREVYETYETEVTDGPDHD